MRLAIAGGTGVVGRQVVNVAAGEGHETVVLSRSAGVDLRDRAQVSAALEGADVIIDVANTATANAKRATAFFTEVTARLASGGASRGVSRLVVLSIVGLERVSGYGYYRAKLAQEQVARRGPLPVTIVRATQFHEFASQILARTRVGPVSFVPIMRVQPIAARSVAEYLVQTAGKPASDDPVEIAGPDQADLVTLARDVARRQHRRLAVLPITFPGATGKAMRHGGQLPGPDAEILGPNFTDWAATADNLH